MRKALRPLVSLLFSLICFVGLANAQTTTIVFDNPVPPGSPDSFVNGVFQGVNFGTSRWRWSPPWGADPTNSAYFSSESVTSRSFTFSPAPRILDSIRVYTTANGTMTLSDGVNPTITRSVTTGSMQLVSTGWTLGSTTATVTFTGGWSLGIDDITHSPAGAPDATPPVNNTPGSGSGFSLRFFGNGVNDIDRVKIQIDDPAASSGGPPADVGAADFTLEFWMNAGAADNPAPAIQCGNDNTWIFGNIVFDRDRYNQDRAYGVSLAGSRLAFGVSGEGTGDMTICGTTNVLDNKWHHVAVQRRRSDGWMWLYVDGVLQARADGPNGDISYPDNGVPGSFCGPGGNQPCTYSDPYLVIGAEKHDAGSPYPSYNGLVDEVQLSNVLRYSANFTRPSQPFSPDENTVALYHFDEGQGDFITDSSGAFGGPSNGVRRYGGTPAGPEWGTQTPLTSPTASQMGQ